MRSLRSPEAPLAMVLERNLHIIYPQDGEKREGKKEDVNELVGSLYRSRVPYPYRIPDQLKSLESRPPTRTQETDFLSAMGTCRDIT